MLIYRYEHNRVVCTSSEFSISGPSLTGHGTVITCPTSSFDTIPRFGFSGSCPTRLMRHERCAVTAEQFNSWKSAGFVDKTRDWDLVVYMVADSSEGIDWRIDSNQVVFNPEFATYIGTTTAAEVTRRAKISV